MRYMILTAGSRYSSSIRLGKVTSYSKSRVGDTVGREILSQVIVSQLTQILARSPRLLSRRCFLCTKEGDGLLS